MYIISYIKVVYDYVLNIRRRFEMKNNRRQAQFLLRSITDDVPQLLLEENNLVFRNELKEDILIPCSSILSIKILPINRIYNPSVGLLKDGMKGFMAHRNAGVFSIYFKFCNERIANSNDYNIARTIINYIEDIKILSLEKIAEEANISPASVSRFINKAGFESFQAFKYEFELFTRDVKMRRIISHTQRFMRTTIENMSESLYVDD